MEGEETLDPKERQQRGLTGDKSSDRHLLGNAQKVLLNPGYRCTGGIFAVNVNRFIDIDGYRGECYAWLRGYPLIDRLADTCLIVFCPLPKGRLR
jgi:hypothetical protein